MFCPSIVQPGEGKEVLFFAKKNQKTFARRGQHGVTLGARLPDVAGKSFLVLYFKKEHFFLFLRLPDAL